MNLTVEVPTNPREDPLKSFGTFGHPAKGVDPVRHPLRRFPQLLHRPVRRVAINHLGDEVMKVINVSRVVCAQ